MSDEAGPAHDRVALVTGASRGIGLAVAQRLCLDGYHVVLAARGTDAIEVAGQELRAAGGAATAISCDVAERASIAALMDEVTERFGTLDVLVNNAGVLPQAKRAETIDYADWDRTLEVNLTSLWALATRARTLMGDRGGVIVNVASAAAYYPSRGLVAYNVSKAGVVMLTKVLALEWARSGIRVIGIAPGKVDTELLAPIKALTEQGKVQLNPQDRYGTPEEVAGLVSFLVGPAAEFMTGVTVPIDGGELLVASPDTPR